MSALGRVMSALAAGEPLDDDQLAEETGLGVLFVAANTTML
jgi:hypothetical protein